MSAFLQIGLVIFLAWSKAPFASFLMGQVRAYGEMEIINFYLFISEKKVHIPPIQKMHQNLGSQKNG